MIEAESVPTQVLLAGMEETIAGQLAGILRRKKQSFKIVSLTELAELQTEPGCQLVFCGLEREDSLDFLRAMRDREQAPSVVVVTRSFDFKHWLDVLEAGASDYCPFPFEEAHIQWILSKAGQNSGSVCPKGGDDP
jgi:DNA-binding response OmpR family regulator